jgi:uncharacterized membrane-anchored protein
MSLPERIRTWLNEETTVWAREGLIGEAQRERILARYPAEEAGSGRLTFALRALAVLVLFAAVVLVISHNWDDLSRSGRMATVISVLVAVQGIGVSYLLRSRPQGAALGLFASCLLYGAAIGLTGQIFHLDAHQPDAYLAWCLGVLPFALLLDYTLLHLLVIGLASIWFVSENQMQWWRTGNELEVIFYALLLTPSAIAGYRRSRPIIIGVVALCWPLLALVAMGNSSKDFNPILLVAPLAIAALHQPGDPRSRGWRVVGVVTATILCIALGHPSESFNSNFWTYTPILTAIGALIIGWGVFKARDSHGKLGAILAASIGSLFVLRELGNSSALVVTLCVVAANLLTLALAIAQMRLGLAEGRLRPYVYGSLVFIVWLIVRYTDIEKEIGMLGMAAFFAVISAGLFFLARLWRSLAEKPVAERMADFHPAWVETLADKVRPLSRRLLVAACVAQVAVIGYMVWNHLQPLRHGERIVVRAEPVDPRDMLKGEYVILGYDFARISDKDAKLLSAQLGAPNDADEDTRKWLPKDTTVFVPLVKKTNGEWTGGKPTLVRPSEGLYLQGLTGYRWRGGNELRFGIEAYYVEEGKGAAWEKLRNTGLLKVTIAVLPNGKAGLVSIDADTTPFKEITGWRTLTGWQSSGSWRDEVVLTSKGFAHNVRKAKDAAIVDPMPDFSKERLVILQDAEGLPIKVESNGTCIRIQAVDPKKNQRQEDKGSALVVIPRDGQNIYNAQGARIRTDNGDRDEADDSER